MFAAMGPLPSPLPLSSAPALSSLAPAHATAPSAFSGVGHSLKESSLQPVFPVAPRLDDLNLAMAMSMLISGPSALKIAIVDPHGVRQVMFVAQPQTSLNCPLLPRFSMSQNLVFTSLGFR